MNTSYLQRKSFFFLSLDKIKRLERKARPEQGNKVSSLDETEWPSELYAHISFRISSKTSNSLTVKMNLILELILFTFVILQNMGLTGFDSKIDG